ncbi:gastric triacylglycerol lipase-like protein, partial [Dinothrombium tinctorium]
KDFWRFSMDEMIEFDLPAIIKYVLNKTNNSTLGYIGHSQGTLLMFGLLASQPQYCNIIKPFVALAPITRIANPKSPVTRIFSNPFLVDYLYHRGDAFFPYKCALNYIGEKGCKFWPFREFCSFLLFLFCGFDQEQLNQKRISTYFAHTPAGTSSWNIAHYGQILGSKKFQKFDYGCTKNFEKYGTSTPPVYDLKNVDANNIAILHSQNDWMSDPEDLNFLRQEVKGKFLLDHQVTFSKWNHIDYIWSRETEKYVNIVVLEILEKFRK